MSGSSGPGTPVGRLTVYLGNVTTVVRLTRSTVLQRYVVSRTLLCTGRLPFHILLGPPTVVHFRNPEVLYQRFHFLFTERRGQCFFPSYRGLSGGPKKTSIVQSMDGYGVNSYNPLSLLTVESLSGPRSYPRRRLGPNGTVSPVFQVVRDNTTLSVIIFFLYHTSNTVQGSLFCYYVRRPQDLVPIRQISF